MKTPCPPGLAHAGRPFGRDGAPPLIAFLVDGNGVIRTESPALSELCGLGGMPVRGRNWLSEFAPAGARGPEAGIIAQAGACREKLWIYEREVLRADGRSVGVLVTAQGAGRLMALELEPLAAPPLPASPRARRECPSRIDVRLETRAIIARCGAPHPPLAPQTASDCLPGSAACAGIDGIPAVLLIVGRDFSIKLMNARARRLFPAVAAGKRRGAGIAGIAPEPTRNTLCEIINSCFKRGEAEPVFLDAGGLKGEPRSYLWSMALNARDDEVVIIAVEAEAALTRAAHPCPEFYEEFGLSAREREIVDLLLEGYEYKEIAWKLSIRLPTVRTHLQRVYRKTGVHAKHELLSKAKAIAAGPKSAGHPGERRLLRFRDPP